MKHIPYRQNPTVIDTSKKARPPPGRSTYEYELSNHLNTAYISFASVCVLQTGAFCLFKKIFEKISENVRRFFKTQYCQTKGGKHHQLSMRR